MSHSGLTQTANIGQALGLPFVPTRNCAEAWCWWNGCAPHTLKLHLQVLRTGSGARCIRGYIAFSFGIRVGAEYLDEVAMALEQPQCIRDAFVVYVPVAINKEIVFPSFAFARARLDLGKIYLVPPETG